MGFLEVRLHSVLGNLVFLEEYLLNLEVLLGFKKAGEVREGPVCEEVVSESDNLDFAVWVLFEGLRDCSKSFISDSVVPNFKVLNALVAHKHLG